MIQNIKDLKSLFKACRAQGVTEIKIMGVEIKFGDLPISSEEINEQNPSQDSTNPWGNFPAGELTPEQLAFYSAGGRPEDDPQNEAAE